MKGLLLRDCFIIRKKYLNRLVIVFLTIGVIGSVALGPFVSSTLGLCFPFLAPVMIINIFSEDEKDNWDRTAKLLPLSTSDIVRARYLVFGIMILVSFCMALLLIALSALVHSEQYTPWYFVFPAVGLVGAMIYVSLVIPFCYKYGAQGSAAVSMGLLILASASGFLVRQDSVLSVILSIAKLPVPVHIINSAIVVLILTLISYFVSLKIYDAKEMK